MSKLAGDIREHAVRPALKEIGLWSEVAEELVMGTGAQESGFQYLEQVRGPALGLWQMEPSTHDSLWIGIIGKNPSILRGLSNLTIETRPNAKEMTWNLRYAAAMCRIKYYSIPERLPFTMDPEALGIYWKKYYNTFLGKGTVPQFVAAYKKHLVDSQVD